MRQSHVTRGCHYSKRVPIDFYIPARSRILRNRPCLARTPDRRGGTMSNLDAALERTRSAAPSTLVQGHRFERMFPGRPPLHPLVENPREPHADHWARPVSSTLRMPRMSRAGSTTSRIGALTSSNNATATQPSPKTTSGHTSTACSTHPTGGTNTPANCSKTYPASPS